MKTILLSLALATALTACTQVPREQRVASNVGPNGEELVCEKVPVPGKIYPGKICMTAEQWAKHKQAGGDAAKDVQRRALSTAAPGSGG